jgi:type IV secretory pathway TrbD component
MTEAEDMGAHAPHDHPVLAVLGGCAVLVIAAVVVPRLLPQQPYATLIGAGAVLALLLWAIGFVATVRHSPIAWKLGSLVILAGAGIVAGLVAHGQYQTRARADASSFAEVEFGPQGAPQMPGDAAARGPISQLFVASAQADALADRDYAAALGRFGAGALNSPYLLQQDPRAIGHCGEIEGIRTLARAQSQARIGRREKLRQAIDATNLSGGAKRGIATLTGTDAQAGKDVVLTNQLAMLDATGELCALLARRGWYNQGGYFGFNSAADKARFDALMVRRKALAVEAAQIARATTDRMQQGRDQVRDALSRSIFAPE